MNRSAVRPNINGESHIIHKRAQIVAQIHLTALDWVKLGV